MTIKINNDSRVRVNLAIPKDNLNDLDLIAKKIGTNRTSLLNVVLKQFIEKEREEGTLRG